MIDLKLEGWTYIAVWADGESAQQFADFDEALRVVYGETEFDQPDGWRLFDYLIIRRQTEAGVTYQEMAREKFQEHGDELRRPPPGGIMDRLQHAADKARAARDHEL